jgi:hypothetical protein
MYKIGDGYCRFVLLQQYVSNILLTSVGAGCNLVDVTPLDGFSMGGGLAYMELLFET